MSNAKILASGMLLYASDWDDILPWAQNTLTAQAVSQPYLKNTTVMKSLNPRGGQLAINGNVGGVQVGPIPVGVPLFYDSKPWPDGSRVVAFVNGSVKIVPKKDWPRVAKMLAKKWKRAAKRPLPKDHWKLVWPKGPPPSAR